MVDRLAHLRYLRKDLLYELDDRLGGRFNRKKKYENAVIYGQVSPNVTWIFRVVQREGINNFFYYVDFGLRWENISRIVFDQSSAFEKKWWSKIANIGLDISRNSVAPDRIEMWSIDDVIPTCDRIVAYLDNVVTPVVRDWSDISIVGERFVRFEPDAVRLAAFPSSAAMIAVAFVLLYRSETDIDGFIRSCENRLAEMNPKAYGNPLRDEFKGHIVARQYISNEPISVIRFREAISGLRARGIIR